MSKQSGLKQEYREIYYVKVDEPLLVGEEVACEGVVDED